jgi:sortase A
MAMNRYKAKRVKTRRTVSARWIVSVFALLFVLAGLGLVAYALMSGDSPVEKVVENATSDEEPAVVAPADTTLYLTVPKMARVDDLPVYSTPLDDESAMEQSAQHVQDTGFPNFPWEEGSNVYIAGHRLGWPGTKSFLVFYDLDVLESGDEVLLTDSEGTKYTYRVFNEYVSGPFDWSPTEPIPGKSVITLQTCTLPDYVQRLVVQAELVSVS